MICSAYMRDGRLVATVFAVSLVYAIARYSVFKGVQWAHLPIYVVNKAVAVTALVSLGISRVVYEKARRKRFGLLAAVLAALHLMLSYMVLSPYYMPSLFKQSNVMTLEAELSMLTGATAACILLWLVHATATHPTAGQPHGTSLVRGFGRAILVLAAFHVALYGSPDWASPSRWPGGLPPITLLSCVAAIAFFLLPRARSEPKG